MGLFERYEDHLAEQARQQAAVADAAFKAAQEAEPLRLQVLADEQQRLADEIKRRAAIRIELSALVETIGAREQLEEVRKVWRVGRVDREPSLFFHPGSIELSLRHKYRDTAPVHYQHGGGDGVSTDDEVGHTLVDMEATQSIAIEKTTDTSYSLNVHFENGMMPGRIKFPTRGGGFFSFLESQPHGYYKSIRLSQDQHDASGRKYDTFLHLPTYGNSRRMPRVGTITPVSIPFDDSLAARNLLEDVLLKQTLDLVSQRPPWLKTS